MKRNLIIATIIFLLLSFGVSWWYFSEETPFLKDMDIYKAVPVSAPFFLEVNSIQNLPADNPILSALEEGGIGQHWFSFIQKADSLITSTENIPNNLRNSNFILAFGFTGRNELFPVIIKKADTQNRRASIELLLEHFYPPGQYDYNQREYGKHTITGVYPNDSGSPLFYTFSDDIFCISPRSILVEQILRQLSTPGILKNPFFLKADRGIRDQKISFYINHEWIGGFFTPVFSRAVTEKTDEFGSTRRYQPSAVAEKYQHFAAWSKLGARFFDDQIFLNGISIADDSLNHFLAVFSGQQPVRSVAEKALPQNTSFFCNFSFSNKQDFFDQLEAFYAHSENFYFREERMKRIDQQFRTHTRNTFKQWVKDEIIVASTTIPVNPENKTTFFILQTTNRQTVEGEFQQLLKNYAARTDQDYSQLLSVLPLDQATEFPIYRFPFPSFPGLWLGSPFTMAETAFVTFYNDFMVFSNTEQGLHEYIRNMTMGANLANDNRLQRFSKNHLNRNNIRVFIDVNKAFGIRSEIFSSKMLQHLKEKEESIRNFDIINFQVSQEKNIFSNSIILSHRTGTSDQTQAVWQVALGSQVQTKPQLVKNHYEPTHQEILFQDAGNNLHLVSSSGQLRWTVPLSGSILGKIHQVDAYKNGKLQYLFNTKEKLYLLDRTGNHVGNFPVSLKSSATNAVSVFDYDNNRNYRCFVATENKKIYAYDVTGKIITGWKFDQTEQAVTTPLQHFKAAAKDYIVFKDPSGIYLVNRQGESRVSDHLKMETSNNPLVIDHSKTPLILTTDKKGKVYFIHPDGKMEEKTTGRYSEDHFFTAGDLDGNGVIDFIFADGNDIVVIDANGRKMFSQKMRNPVTTPPKIYTLTENQKKIGVVDALFNRIYLFDNQGKLHPGFPLPGNGEFIIETLIENSGSLHLVTGCEGGILCNYSLQ